MAATQPILATSHNFHNLPAEIVRAISWAAMEPTPTAKIMKGLVWLDHYRGLSWLTVADRDLDPGTFIKCSEEDWRRTGVHETYYSELRTFDHVKPDRIRERRDAYIRREQARMPAPPAGWE